MWFEGWRARRARREASLLAMRAARRDGRAMGDELGGEKVGDCAEREEA